MQRILLLVLFTYSFLPFSRAQEVGLVYKENNQALAYVRNPEYYGNGAVSSNHQRSSSSSLLKPRSFHSKTQKKATTRTQLFHYDEFWISGCIGAGAVVSTNIINTGAVLPFRTEFLWQRRHRRLGFGFGSDLYMTPQSLINLVVNKSVGIHKLYFAYEVFIFRNFPINLGFSSHLGFFYTGTLKTDSTNTYNHPNNSGVPAVNNTTNNPNLGGLFGNVGCVLELGVRPFYIFARPSIEYQSWSGFHKQIQATAQVGIRLKFLSQEEKQRRAAKKAARRSRHHRPRSRRHN